MYPYNCSISVVLNLMLLSMRSIILFSRSGLNCGSSMDHNLFEDILTYYEIYFYLFICLFVCLFVYLFIYLFIYLYMNIWFSIKIELV